MENNDHEHNVEQRPPAEISRLLGLPLELQYLIISYLDWHDARRLRLTCRFYSDLLNYNVMESILQRIFDTDRGVELFYLWHYSPHLKEGSRETFVCSGCRWILPKECYSLYDIGSLPENRLCFVCKVRDQRMVPREGVVHKLEGGFISYCGRCGRLTRHSRTVSLALRTCYWCSSCSVKVGREMRQLSNAGYILKLLQIVIAFLVMCLAPTIPFKGLKIGGAFLGSFTAVIHGVRLKILLKGQAMHRWHSVACYVRYWTKETFYFLAWLAYSLVALFTMLWNAERKYMVPNIRNLMWAVIACSFLETVCFFWAALLALCISCNVLDGYMNKV